MLLSFITVFIYYRLVCNITDLGNHENASLFTEECWSNIQVACAEAMGRFEAIKSGSIVVEELQLINDHIDRFVTIMGSLRKNVGKREVEQIIQLRMREIDAFTRQQGQLKTFVNLCQHGQGKL